MSRIGKDFITIEEGVEVSLNGLTVLVKGPLGEINITLPEHLELKIEEKSLQLNRKDETKQAKSDHGTYRMLLYNAVYGVKNCFSKNLELVGVGYRARLDGGLLVMSLGWNHPIKMTPPEGIQIEVPEETKITIKGFDKQKVGEFAAKIREIRKPEPYKGKGIRYENEYVRRKSSKASVA